MDDQIVDCHEFRGLPDDPLGGQKTFPYSDSEANRTTQRFYARSRTGYPKDSSIQLKFSSSVQMKTFNPLLLLNLVIQAQKTGMLKC